MSRIKTIGIVLCFVMLWLLPACSKQEESQVVTTEKPAPSEQENTAMKEDDNHGEKVYQQTCSGCHKTGVSGAPKLGDESDWSSLLTKDKEILIQNSINGIGAMPAKGGNPSLSDDDIRAAVEYMMDQSR